VPIQLMIKVTDIETPLKDDDLKNIDISKLKLGKVEYYKPSHSFTHQFGQMLGLAFKSAALVAGMKDIAATTTVESQAQYMMFGGSTVGQITYGIVVGRDGATAESINDYKLGTICPHGTAANNLSYSNSPFLDPYVVTTTTYLTQNRVVANYSAATVTIAEVGIYCLAGTSAHTYCIVRDVLGAPIDIIVGSAKLIQYIFTSVN